MIKGKQVQAKVFADKSVLNYRKINALNQSMLKLFDSDPIKFYSEVKEGKKRKEKKSIALIIGDIVDFYLLSCNGDEVVFNNRMEEKFILYDGVKGSGQVFLLADYIFEEAESCVNEKNEVTCAFLTMFSTAFIKIQNEGKYKGKSEDKALEDFYENGKAYYDKLMANIGKTVVEASLIDKAKGVAERLKKDPFTHNIFKGSGDTEFLTHYVIEWNYNLEANKSFKCKSEVDILIVDHDNQVIRPIDLKTTYDNENFDYNYIKNGYYIQNAFYVKAVEEWAKSKNLESYTINPMLFIVGDTSSNNRRPLLYETSNLDVDNGMYGFSVRGNYYKGVDEIIRDIAWAEEKDIWDCSREAYNKQGKLNLNIKYD